jgi:hypothetical protein
VQQSCTAESNHRAIAQEQEQSHCFSRGYQSRGDPLMALHAILLALALFILISHLVIAARGRQRDLNRSETLASIARATDDEQRASLDY